MRGVDLDLAYLLKLHWQGMGESNVELCPLLADLDRLLVYLDEVGIRPGRVIDPCPECGQEHRWALLNLLMIYALQIREANQSKLLTEVDKRLEPVRQLYGGEEGYRALGGAADDYLVAGDNDKSRAP